MAQWHRVTFPIHLLAIFPSPLSNPGPLQERGTSASFILCLCFISATKMLNHIIQHPRPWHNQKQAAISNIVLQSCMYNFANGKFCISIYHLDINQLQHICINVLYFCSVYLRPTINNAVPCNATRNLT